MSKLKTIKQHKSKIIVLMILLAATAFSATRIIAQSTDKKKGPEFLGTSTCLQCHDGYDKSFMATKHRMLFSSTTEKGPKFGCEACHGAAGDHMNDAATGVVRFEKLSPAKQSAVCLRCHDNDTRKNWRMSAHSQEGVSCLSCHEVHKKTSSKIEKSKNDTPSLLVDNEPDLCIKCHKEKAAGLTMPSRHPIREGKVLCSDCHSPHDNSPAAMEAAKTGCVKCHAEKVGPFLYEHEPVSEDCTTCHAPHGSMNRPMLTQRQPSLCMQCHAVATAPHDITSAAFQKCTNCHESIHGSNSSDTFQGK